MDMRLTLFLFTDIVLNLQLNIQKLIKVMISVLKDPARNI